MNPVEVVEVESASQRRQFIRYSYQLYRGDPCFVPPLLSEREEFFNPDRNPFFRGARVKLFLAYRSGELVGRIAACVNYRHNDYHQDKTGFFGFFDTIDDQEVASKLLKVVMITLKQEGMDRMRGPMNFSTNHEVGFLVEGFDSPPVVMMTYNRPYQVRLAEAFGLKKVMDLLAYELTRESGIPERIRRVVEHRRRKAGITIRSLNMRRFDEEVSRIHQVYNQAWAYNWGFVPMDEEEFRHMGTQLRQIVDPNLVLIAEHEGRPVGFSLALPDINQVLIRLNGRLFPFGLIKLLWYTKVRSVIDTVRLVTFGVVPEYQKRAIDSMLYLETFERGVERGYRRAELSWILETNHLMLRAVEEMGARLYKRYRIMEMPL